MGDSLLARPVILTLGTFDGVHRGHQRLLKLARQRARAVHGDVLAVAFERPPRHHFVPLQSPFLLTTPEEKTDLLLRFGADRVESLPFGARLASLSAGEFLQSFLLKKWHAQELVVGFNFRFGKDRQGDVRFLAREGRRWGLRLRSVGAVRDRSGVVSSGRIRTLILEGKLSDSKALLGHGLPLWGRVVRGRGVGRGIGFATANLSVGGEKIVPSGVFAVKAILPTGVERRGLLNVGFRPTFRGKTRRRSVEVHLLDFSGDLTGRVLQVEIVRKLRDEKKFSSTQVLVRQIRRDESAVRALPSAAWK
ncbi:MAG: riboflavin biosynthesis protein RibF [Elusimicrobia bacterium]|nr:riboflavin biosynthesis protein RibF [Elusimicrobiota bacterium]